MHKKIFILFLFCILLIGIVSVSVSAVKPTQQGADVFLQGYDIEFTGISVYKNGEYIEFTSHVYNISDGLELDGSTTVCKFDLLDNRGSHILNEVEMTYVVADSDWELNVTGGNFTRNGEYCHLIHCNSTDFGGFEESCFLVNNYGLELTEAENSLFKGGMFLLVIFLVGSLVCLYKFEHYIAKFVFYWISHLLIILISFSVWQFTDGYALGYVGIAGIFRIIFYFFSIAVFPMVLSSIAWIVYIHAFNDHFQKLVDKGEDPETAFAMTKKKRKRRW